MEFEDHRQYQLGDDLRRVDPHLYMRFGEPFVRQYNVTHRLSVTIILDASRSMAGGVPSKVSAAKRLAQGLAFVALASSDLVQVAVWSGNRITWRAGQSGLGRSGELEQWLDAWQGDGGTDLLGAVNSIRNRLTPGSLTIVISDFWSDTALQAIDSLGAALQSTVAIQLMAPEELRPEIYGDGPLRLVDVETGDEVDIALNETAVQRYRELLQGWTTGLKRRVFASRGRYAFVSSADSLEHVFLRTLPMAGVLR